MFLGQCRVVDPLLGSNRMVAVVAVSDCVYVTNVDILYWAARVDGSHWLLWCKMAEN